MTDWEWKNLTGWATCNPLKFWFCLGFSIAAAIVSHINDCKFLTIWCLINCIISIWAVAACSAARKFVAKGRESGTNNERRNE